MTIEKYNNLTQNYLKSILDYNENTGEFIWKIAISDCLKIGKIAGHFNKTLGYNVIRINKQSYRSHRLAFFYTYGKWPTTYIDHINGIKNDNRINNLREVDHRLNLHNTYKHRNGKLIGCSYHKTKKKWIANIQVNKIRYQIGAYSTELEAHEAYNQVTYLLKQDKII